jgi:protein-disulfide isomerase
LALAGVPASGQAISRRTILIASAVAVVAAIALVAAALLLRDDDGGSNGAPTAAVDLEGIEQEGSLLGSGDADVRLIEYADLQCPACREYTLEVFPTLVADYVRPGRVQAEFRGLAFIGPDSEKALRFVLAAGLQNRLWNLQDALYRNQGDENSGWVTDELVRELAGEIEGLDVDRLFADAPSAAVTTLMEEDESQARADEVPGTPTLLVQIGEAAPYRIEVGFDPAQLAAALDDALAG